VVLVALGAALALLAPVAGADDAAVERAWSSEDAAFAREGRALERALARWDRSGLRRTGPVVAAIRRQERLVLRVERRVRAARSSTRDGTEGRTLALSALRQFRSSLRNLRRAVLAAARGRTATARRLARLSTREAERAEAATSRGVEAFQRARGESPGGSPTPGPSPPPSRPSPPSQPSQPPQPSPPPPSSSSGGGSQQPSQPSPSGGGSEPQQPSPPGPTVPGLPSLPALSGGGPA